MKIMLSDLQSEFESTCWSSPSENLCNILVCEQSVAVLLSASLLFSVVLYWEKRAQSTEQQRLIYTIHQINERLINPDPGERPPGTTNHTHQRTERQNEKGRAFALCCNSGCERRRPSPRTQRPEGCALRGFRSRRAQRRPAAPPAADSPVSVKNERPALAGPPRAAHVPAVAPGPRELRGPGPGRSAAAGSAQRLLVRTGAGAGRQARPHRRLAPVAAANCLRAYGAASHRAPDVASGTLRPGPAGRRAPQRGALPRPRPPRPARPEPPAPGPGPASAPPARPLCPGAAAAARPRALT